MVNHLGGPVPDEATPSIAIGHFGAWRSGLREVAKRPNIVLKLGGIGMPVYGFGLQDAIRPDSSALSELWRPYFEVVIEIFGPKRTAVCLRATSPSTSRVSTTTAS